ncbi:alpha/beta fold hydrolase [uncultured Roseibium sp.]|uniref:alpha/beta hydrolase n=1 Tax=uncultured Roseibium sp. TaxID=1936171 RepID=UPI0032163761
MFDKKIYPAYHTVRIGASAGLLHGTCGRTGILICDDWAYESLCARRSLRILADDLAGDGYPVLRFDYPSMGETIPEPGGDVDSLAPLVDTVLQACATLRSSSGVTQIVIVGLGFGSAIATRLATLPEADISGVVLLAPVTSGRAYFRELQLRAAMISNITNVKPEPVPGVALSIAGLDMRDGLAAEVKALRISPDMLPDTIPALVLSRPGRANEAAFAEQIAARNPANTTATFDGYDDLMTDPTAAMTPVEAFGTVVEWIKDRFPAAPATDVGEKLAPFPLKGDGFSETIELLGCERQIVGTWCEPEGERTGSAVLFLNAGALPRSGWAGSVKNTQRWLARNGIPSLRIDVSDVGDSRPVSFSAEIVHYTAEQVEDVRDALDFLQKRGCGHIVAAGSCSGAYLALRSAIADDRISDVVAVNLQRFLWDPRDDLRNALRFDHTDTSAYARKLIDKEKLKRLLSGEIPIFSLATFLLQRTLRKVEQKLAPYLFGLSPFARICRQVHSELRALSDRGTRVDLIFSIGDPGIPHMEHILGKDGMRAASYPGLELTFINGADHNLTPKCALEIYQQKILQAAFSDPERTASAA